MQFTPLEVSNAFISRHGGTGGLTHMKLQKLGYLTHAYWLQENNDRIVSTDPEVWQYGPVFSGLYHNLKIHRNDPITRPTSEALDFNSPPIPQDDRLLNLVDRIWKKYGNYTGGRLSDLTHKPGSPWYQMAKKYDFRVPEGLKISEDIIRHHYRTEIPRLPT